VNGWSLTYEGFLPTEEGRREALCTLGNGVFATRGAAPEAGDQSLGAGEGESHQLPSMR